MKVKQEHLAELRNTILASIKDVGMQEKVLEYVIMKYLPKEGEISLSDLIHDEYYDVFEHLFEDDNSDEALIGRLHDLWTEVGLHDFGIPYFKKPNNEDEFNLYCDDMEILFDEMEMKMKKFVDAAELILEYDVVYELHEADRVGEVCGVEARSKRRGF